MVQKKVAIVGSGLIGRGWAMLFAGAGYKVGLYDVSRDLVEVAITDIRTQLQTLESTGMLRGKLSVPQQLELIQYSPTLKECLEGACYIQENAPESLDLKKSIFNEMDELVEDENIIMASSTSALPASLFSKDMKHRSQVLVAHPVNPPFYLPLVELVPAPWTRPDIIAEARNIMEQLGQRPVSLTREIPGFALNRLQAAILNESWHLVKEGYLSVDDLDAVMSHGLGPRYAFFGPLETNHLTGEGIKNTVERYGDTFYRLSQTLSPPLQYQGPGLQEIAAQANARVPLDKLQEERAWRNTCLAALAKLKQDLKKPHMGN